MRVPDEPENSPQINIVPMIDIIFSILAYFIISSLFLSKSEGLPVNLPKASTAQVQAETRKMTITLDAEGVISLDKEEIELDSLEENLRDRIEKEGESLVILNADEALDHGRVVAVMDKVRRIEGAKLAIAAKKQ
ncbi:ExbD/TolR family protein [Oxynema aestuarii]|uniref:Biopolymer transporter ExbD n=1 Tax=Oxynema aestuarii AP17 TaxID=2064643 RepID=A0A6H1TVA3_9CYAN|nr:biopolymer transporter ExbD [Oxynema aestuarii]QIZ70554.1 biopolymer transporter ExbD [Oxynema aestuarii AP17]